MRPYNIKHRNIFNVAHAKFEYRKQSVSFCCLYCFTITSCTVPVLNYHSERVEVFKGFYMVRWTIPDLQSEDSETFGSKVTWKCFLILKLNLYFSLTSLLNIQTKGQWSKLVLVSSKLRNWLSLIKVFNWFAADLQILLICKLRLSLSSIRKPST